jgi:hypothetical protein
MAIKQLKTGHGTKLVKRLKVCNMPDKIHYAEYNCMTIYIYIYIYIYTRIFCCSSCVDLQLEGIGTKSIFEIFSLLS